MITKFWSCFIYMLSSYNFIQCWLKVKSQIIIIIEIIISLLLWCWFLLLDDFTVFDFIY